MEAKNKNYTKCSYENLVAERAHTGRADGYFVCEDETCHAAIRVNQGMFAGFVFDSSIVTVTLITNKEPQNSLAA